MKKTIKTLIIFLVLIILGINSQVYAATTTFKANNTTVNVGDEVTVTATVTAAQWDLKIKLNGKTLAESSELENYESNITKTITAKYKTTEKGKLDFKLEGDITDVNQENKTINDKVSVTVNEKTVTPPATETQKPETSKPETPTQKPVETPKSSEARLKNFGIKPAEYDFKGFKKDQLEGYSVEVPNSVTSVEVYAEPVDAKAKVSGVGKVTLNEGSNTIGVTVTAEDGTTKKTYKVTIKRKTQAEEEAEKGENRLKSLSINPEEYDFKGFDSDKTEYSVEVPNELKEIEVVAIAMDSNAQIMGTGIIELEEGENELKVVVIAVNGDKKTYTLTVTRKEAEVKEILGLTSLSIKGLELTPSFKTGTYEYTAELEEDLTSLEITAKANSEEATVEIIGNENLQNGENTITILVENEETEEVATYQITVNKNVVVVAEIVEKTSWLKPSTWGKEELIKIAIIIVLIILIICAIILKRKISKDSSEAIKVDFPGAEELDKAILEHQELVQEENFMQGIIGEKNTHINEDEQNYIEEIAMNKFEVEDFDEKPKRKGRHF